MSTAKSSPNQAMTLFNRRRKQAETEAEKPKRLVDEQPVIPVRHSEGDSVSVINSYSEVRQCIHSAMTGAMDASDDRGTIASDMIASCIVAELLDHALLEMEKGTGGHDGEHSKRKIETMANNISYFVAKRITATICRWPMWVRVALAENSEERHQAHCDALDDRYSLMFEHPGRHNPVGALIQESKHAFGEGLVKMRSLMEIASDHIESENDGER